METLKYIQNITSLVLWFLTIVAEHKMEGTIEVPKAELTELETFRHTTLCEQENFS